MGIVLLKPLSDFFTISDKTGWRLQEHSYTATTYNNLGGAYASKGEFDRAIEFFQKALNILEKKHQGRHPLTEEVADSLLILYRLKGESDKASELARWFVKVKSECRKSS